MVVSVKLESKSEMCVEACNYKVQQTIISLVCAQKSLSKWFHYIKIKINK